MAATDRKEILKGIAERLIEIRETNRLKPAQFAKRIGDRVQRVVDCERGKQRPPADYLAAVIIEFDINGDWLLTGDLPKTVDSRPQPLVNTNLIERQSIEQHLVEQNRALIEQVRILTNALLEKLNGH